MTVLARGVIYQFPHTTGSPIPPFRNGLVF